MLVYLFDVGFPLLHIARERQHLLANFDNLFAHALGCRPQRINLYAQTG